MRTFMITTVLIFSVAVSLAFRANDSISIWTPVTTKILSGIVTDDNGEALIGANVTSKCSNTGTVTDIDGLFELQVPNDCDEIEISYAGYNSSIVKLTTTNHRKLKIQLTANMLLDEIIVSGIGHVSNKSYASSPKVSSHSMNDVLSARMAGIHIRHGENVDTEQYGTIVENKFVDPLTEALSTFSIDVDRASYSNVRRFIDNGQLPPKNAVRIEEMINYFDYDYPQPDGNDPIALHSSYTNCPWNSNHSLLHIGLQAKQIPLDNLPASNLVFLIDVSGSMGSPNKLGLLKSSFKMLVNNLRATDKVSIVTYAGSAGIVLKPTSADQKIKILEAIAALGAGGSTAGAEGIKTAYKLAKQNFIKNGNNRVILATDGDFNVGVNSNEGLEALIEEKRNSGIFLSVLGFGMGNYKDEQMQTLADKGNGNHAYIDNIQEARKVFVSEFGGTLFTVAKDVKLQLEFNPAHVAAYRLIGYENRLLNKEDFNDDTKDAGEIGSGHVVTAMYEIVPVGSNSVYIGNVDALKYQENKKRPDKKHSDELASIKFRYKAPSGNTSKKLVRTIAPSLTPLGSTSEDIRFSIAVAQFGAMLRNSDYTKESSMNDIIALAEGARDKDKEGYRAEFIRLVKSVKEMEGDVAEK